MKSSAIDAVCDELLANGGNPEIVKIMRANMHAAHQFEAAGVTPNEAMRMVIAANAVTGAARPVTRRRTTSPESYGIARRAR